MNQQTYTTCREFPEGETSSAGPRPRPNSRRLKAAQSLEGPEAQLGRLSLIF